MEHLKIQKYSGQVLGLYIGVGSSDIINGKKCHHDGGIGYALVNDFFGTFPPLRQSYKKSRFQVHSERFFIKDDYVISQNPTLGNIMYRVCLVEDKIGFDDFMKNVVHKSAYKPPIVIGATDSNFRIALITNAVINENKKSDYVKDAENACDFTIGYINRNPNKIII